MSEIHVSELSIYPIKSCGPISADSFEINETGLQFDREWVLTRENGTFISQRTNPELALVGTRLTENKLVISAPIVGSFAVPLVRQSTDEIEIDIFKKPGTGTDEGDVAANYFSDYLGKAVRLYRLQKPRQTKPECRIEGASSVVSFADGFQMLLTSNKSLEELNKYSSEYLTMSRFRPNIVVDGTDLEPYAEDHWRQVKIGTNAGIHIVRACARCPMPNIDQTVGVLPKPHERTATEALKLSRSGFDPLNGKAEVFFGQNLSHNFQPGSVIKVGDSVSVIDKATERNFLPTDE